MHGRWVVIFVPASSLISPHLLRGRGADAAPRRAAPRRDAGQRSRGAGWCAVVLVRMHISVPHILIQGVITRLSSAHSHHCLNHPPPPSGTLLEFSPVPLPPRPRVVLHLPHLHSHRRPPVALLRRPDHPIYPTRTFTTPPAGRIFLQTGPSLILAPLPSQLKRHASLVSLSLFPCFPPPVSCLEPRVCSPGDTWGAARVHSRVSSSLARQLA